MDSNLLEYNSLNNSYWAAILLKLKEADCAIGGSISSTAELMRAVINCLGLLPGKKTLSGSAFVEVPDCPYGLDGIFCVTDPAIIQRLAKAEVCGTVIEGAARPFNDLSRGCLAKDIITLTAMTLLQAEGMDNAAI